LYVEDVVKHRVKYENAELVVPEGPGLGVELDEDKVKELAGEV
jgi:muconate cycloisomerase